MFENFFSINFLASPEEEESMYRIYSSSSNAVEMFMFTVERVFKVG